MCEYAELYGCKKCDEAVLENGIVIGCLSEIEDQHYAELMTTNQYREFEID
jgi:hypothetical protein